MCLPADQEEQTRVGSVRPTAGSAWGDIVLSVNRRLSINMALRLADDFGGSNVQNSGKLHNLLLHILWVYHFAYLPITRIFMLHASQSSRFG